MSSDDFRSSSASSPLAPSPKDADRRDRSRLAAAKRKARQRQRQRSDGRTRLELSAAPAVLDALNQAAQLAGTSPKTEAELILAVHAANHLTELTALATRAAKAWAGARPLWPYAEHLAKPGAIITVKGRTYTHEAWKAVHDELSACEAYLARSRRWGRSRITTFLKHAADLPVRS